MPSSPALDLLRYTRCPPPGYIIHDPSSQSLACEARQDEARPVDLLVVVSAKLFLFFQAPGPHWLLNVSARIFTADHEADLAGGVGGNGGVSVFDDREDLLARLLK
jgi:hypothetical protein